MDFPDFSVEEEINKVLSILEKACERFGVCVPAPEQKEAKVESNPTDGGGGNGVRK